MPTIFKKSTQFISNVSKTVKSSTIKESRSPFSITERNLKGILATKERSCKISASFYPRKIPRKVDIIWPSHRLSRD